MVKTFDTSRVGGGTYQLEQGSDGNYTLKKTGFEQVNKLKLPDLTNLDLPATTTTKPEDKKDVADPFKKLASQQDGGGDNNQDYSGVMLKSPEVKQATVREAGEATNTTYNAMSDAEKASVAAGTSGMTFRGAETSRQVGPPGDANIETIDTTKTYTTPRTIADQNEYLGRTFTDKTTGLQDVVTKTSGFKDSLSKAASKSIALNAIKGAAQGLGAFLGAILPDETNSQTHAKSYFNTSQVGAQAQRISGNPANDLYAGANANARELDGYGTKRIDTISKTISKMTPAQKAKSSLPARKEKFEKQQKEYREDRAAAKDKASGNTKTNVTGFGKSGFGRDTSGGGGDTGGGGGRVICTDLHRTGELSTRDWIRDTKFTFTTLSKKHVKGYLLWAEPTVKHIQRYPRYRKMWKHIAQHRANDIAWRLNEGKFDLLGRIYASIGEPVCWVLGNFVSDKQISKYNLTHWRRA